MGQGCSHMAFDLHWFDSWQCSKLTTKHSKIIGTKAKIIKSIFVMTYMYCTIYGMRLYSYCMSDFDYILFEVFPLKRISMICCNFVSISIYFHDISTTVWCENSDFYFHLHALGCHKCEWSMHSTISSNKVSNRTFKI